MVTIKYHGSTGYDNGLLEIHLRDGDLVGITQDQYVKMRADLGPVRFRSEVEILSPAKLRQVGEYFKDA